MKITLPKLYENPRYEKLEAKEKITINENKTTCVNYRNIVKDNEAEVERLKAER